MEAKRIVKVEWDRVRDLVGLGELREGTWVTTSHVVSSVRLREVLQESNEKDDLPLGDIGEGIPLLRRRSGIRGEWSAIGGKGPRPVDSVGLDDVTNESRHSNTTVLDLGLTQETNAGLIALTPDVDVSQLKRVVVLGAKTKRELILSNHIQSSNIPSPTKEIQYNRIDQTQLMLRPSHRDTTWTLYRCYATLRCLLSPPNIYPATTHAPSRQGWTFQQDPSSLP